MILKQRKWDRSTF